MSDTTIIVLDPAHITMHMLVQRMRAGLPVDTSSEMGLRRTALVAGLEAWALRNNLTLAWTDTPGRRAKGREYRIAYYGEDLNAQERQVLVDGFDAEMRRLILR